MLVSLHRFEEAILILNRALEEEPANDRAWCNKGIALSGLERYEEAIRSFDRTLEINNRCTRAIYEKANAISNLGNQSEAVALYDYALKNEPDNPKILYFKGVALSRNESDMMMQLIPLNGHLLLSRKMLPGIIILVWLMQEKRDIMMQ